MQSGVHGQGGGSAQDGQAARPENQRDILSAEPAERKRDTFGERPEKARVFW